MQACVMANYKIARSTQSAGGKARARKLSKRRRQAIARLGGLAKWKKVLTPV